MLALIISGLCICGGVLFSASLYSLNCPSWAFLLRWGWRWWDLACQGRPGLLQWCWETSQGAQPSPAEGLSEYWGGPFSVVHLGPTLFVHHIVQTDLKFSDSDLGNWPCLQASDGFVWILRSPFIKRSYCHLLEKLYNDAINLGRLWSTP